MKVQEFINHISKICNYAEKTCKCYSTTLNDFFRFVDGREVTPNIIMEYIMFKRDAGCSAVSCNNYISAIRSYYDYCCRFEGCALNPAAGIRNIKTGKNLPLFMTENVMNDLLDNRLRRDTFKRYRTFLVILFFYHTGVRCSELAKVRDVDICYDKKYVKIYGKGRKERMVPFGDELYYHLREFTKMRNSELDSTDGHLFTNVHGQGLTDFQIRIITKQALLRVVAPKFAHPHVLRHTFATAMMNHGAKIENVALLLGHESVDTTTIYEHVSINYLQSIHNKVFK